MFAFEVETPAAAGWGTPLGRLLAYSIGTLPLICAPNLARPFSTPKLWLLAALAAMAVLLLIRIGRGVGPGLRGFEWAVAGWLAALGASASFGTADLQALVMLALPAPLLLALARGAIPAATLMRALVLGSAVESAVAVLQFVRLDPLQFLGWRPEQFPSPRMRVYGTFGNPNFVAAWLVATAALAAVWALRGTGWQRWLRWAIVALQFAAIAATGSRAALLALPVGGAVLLLGRVRARVWWAGAACVAAVLLWLTPARPLAVTLAGRASIDQTVLRHVLEVPLLGYGPGAFAQRFPGWQTEAERAAGETSRFNGALDHAHNDYLELYVDTGAFGLGALLVMSAMLLARGFTQLRGTGGAPGAMAGAIGLLAIALVDFPLHRPAEWGLYWLLLGLVAGPGCQAAAVEESRTGASPGDERRKL